MLQLLLDVHLDRKKAKEEKMRLMRLAKEQAALPANCDLPSGQIREPGTVIEMHVHGIYYQNMHGEIMLFKDSDFDKLNDQGLVEPMEICKIDSQGVRLQE